MLASRTLPFLAVVLALVAATAAGADEGLRIEEAVRFALERNPEELVSAEAQLFKALGQEGPTR